MATINDNGVYKTPTGQIVWNAERPTVAMGSPLAAKDAKMPSFIQAILDKNGATAKEHIVLRSLSAVQYVLGT